MVEMEEKGYKRVSSRYEEEEYIKLKRLSTACGITPTTLQTFFTRLCMNNETILNFTQQHFDDSSLFRVIPSKIDGKVELIFAEKPNKKKRRV